jgi:plasmid stability protein
VTNLNIKNIPRPLYERLKARAERNRRSLNSEVIWCLERSTGAVPIDPDTLLARVRAVRERAHLPYLTDEELRAVRDEGRA